MSGMRDIRSAFQPEITAVHQAEEVPVCHHRSTQYQELHVTHKSCTRLLKAVDYLMLHDYQSHEVALKYARRDSQEVAYFNVAKQCAFEGQQQQILGVWHYDKELPFLVPGHPSYNDYNVFPQIVTWPNMTSFCEMAAAVLVSGDDGWYLQDIKMEAAGENDDGVLLYKSADGQ